MTTVTNKDGIEFDIDALATVVNGKLDIDCLNHSDAGYSVMAGAGMPSDTYVDLTLGVSDSTYTAPANGWFFLQKWSNAVGQYIGFENNSNKMSIEMDSSIKNQLMRIFLPVTKNTVVTCYYTAAGTMEYFRFIYAEGSKSEAN